MRKYTSEELLWIVLWLELLVEPAQENRPLRIDLKNILEIVLLSYTMTTIIEDTMTWLTKNAQS